MFVWLCKQPCEKEEEIVSRYERLSKIIDKCVALYRGRATIARRRSTRANELLAVEWRISELPQTTIHNPKWTKEVLGEQTRTKPTSLAAGGIFTNYHRARILRSRRDSPSKWWRLLSLALNPEDRIWKRQVIWHLVICGIVLGDLPGDDPLAWSRLQAPNLTLGPPIICQDTLRICKHEPYRYQCRRWYERRSK